MDLLTGIRWQLEVFVDEGNFSFLPSTMFFVWCIKMMYIVIVDGVSEACGQWLGTLFKFHCNCQPDCGIRSAIVLVVELSEFY